MHLLAATPGTILDGEEAVDLGQTPGDIVILSAADGELAGLARARDAEGPSLRLANVMSLGHNMSVDIYVEDVVARAKLVVIRLLGGSGYWAYGTEQVAATCRERGIPLALLPGDDQPDAELASLCTLPEAGWHRLWQYFVHGGAENFRNLLAYAATLTGQPAPWIEPLPLARAGLYWPGSSVSAIDDLRPHWRTEASTVALIFYRALTQADDLAPIDALIAALGKRGLNPLPIFVASLKDPVSAATLEALFADAPPAVIVNATGFAVSRPGAPAEGPLDGCDVPILQAILSGGSEKAWRDGTAGLSARDIAMNVALPEVDGRIITRAISFKSEARYDEAAEISLRAHAPVADRVAFVADLAQAWCTLSQTPVGERRVAMVLANYPNRDGRLGNGVGLDTPASAQGLLEAMAAAGYRIEDMPDDGRALIERLAQGPTNALAGRAAKTGGVRYPLADYLTFFDSLSDSVRDAVIARWGDAESDPFVDGDAFLLPAHRLGNVALCLQPARGYNIDPASTYHNPDLVPPHGYLAFYAWLRHGFACHAVVDMGKHGNLEWLPGKALALSEACFPEVAFGPLPHLYPFIVNDPGEGTQAKRRAQAVIVDHLTPPLTRAESYGPLADLESLVDEYYEAAGVDPRRLALLRDDILDLSRQLGLDKDCGFAGDDDDTALAKLDNHLCELKEMQIRDGLHILGSAPEGDQLTDLLVALARLPRGEAPGEASLMRALAGDLELNFDPLDCVMSETWTGPKPVALGSGAWRSHGDTVERIEDLARALVTGERTADAAWQRSIAVLDEIETRIRPAVLASGEAETAALLAGLDGRFVAPGPSGAPTRGRLDVLPTGRNFYSIDTRMVPTPTAWRLGWKSAGLLLDRYRQDHGAWPTSLAISAWGTANMRTGGDDIAQALALLGVQPSWDTASRRVTGFEILPVSVLDRPRVDVVFRISGFFRDAFPAQIDLIDSAVRAVAALDEPAADNPLAARVRAERDVLCAKGLSEDEATARAGHRVFGAKPGAYGAGLQALIDEKGWESDADLARAYLAWGGYAYGAAAKGEARHGLFEARLRGVQGVVQNQDNREHDLLDSDDYYQFEGGMAAAVRHLSGAAPAVYHNDHSRPESPRIRSLEEEIARVVRARVVNPKWIAGVMRHGYKGAFEMAATVDYLFAFAATAHAVTDHHFDAVYEAYLEDDAVREFLLDANPAAAREMAERLLEAQARGLWQPRANDTGQRLGEIAR
jgi:cobaltochelatase CobN